MTARSDDPGPGGSQESPTVAAAAGASECGGEIWGTLEELVLACAVRRHGTSSWEAVAMEVQSRSRSAAGLTPASCRLRFRLLHRRFTGGGATAEDENGDGGGEEEPDAAAIDGWAEELRKLRVAELRRDVERYDLSIGRLQSKVKRLEKERERSLSGDAKTAEEEVRKGSQEVPGVDDRVSGQESGRSFKESNSSDLKRPEDDTAANDDPAAREEATAGKVTVKEEPSDESVAGSKEAADAEMESTQSSDVQSSANPSHRRRKGSGTEEAEPAAEEASPSLSVPLTAAESSPLVTFLKSVQTSKSGTVFERRLESQEGDKYNGTIKRHVDLEMVRSKLEGGGATCYSSAAEFYRDLLLLCANAIVFFPRGSPEHAAGVHTRALISKQISKNHPAGSLGKVPLAASAETSKKPKAEADVAGSLLEKAAPKPPIIVCRKRSSTTKVAAAAAKEEKAEKAETDYKEKDGDEKMSAAAVTTAKKKARGLRTNKSRAPARNAGPNQKIAKTSECAEGTKKSDKKGGGGGGSTVTAAGGIVKKRNAVDFLNRMNQNGSPSTERVSFLETQKLSAATEQKKSSSSSGKGDGRKEPGCSGSQKATAATDTPPGRRTVSRPPKRAAAPPLPPPSKRAKDVKAPSKKRGKK
ncbi:hypothetical protein GUJ93_ZPchr0010g8365 [Zizania palustris]|uniref:Bromo domain-containing protein n=1 Tax=Zizania palustris TaxID=103762 RepID=A0A8J6BR02_ZIZPA|nr:hypothetical protein GUJ93_ZPchr0010g8365 [Zizania palustris]